MTDRERFDSAWARELERRFQMEVADETKAVWTRDSIEQLSMSHGLKLCWQSNSLCFVSHPIGMEGLVALRVGESITDDQIDQLETLKQLAALPRPIPT